ncbi:L,D-transpeptidase [Leptolyngbya sp. NK1-12]|uniref:L,D-transpeptidase n=1 Tax=Leptolyngbya sp. NK1-12 TaxID=2547451 RepID=A0AA96WFV9_9CYAN|nr:L,D-transpeptidase [Leptolyngbya sp. NK1-12]WNZ24433.1 L,D-transpeptidase [Leptolyngbya sp. NK1-12]
MTERCARLPDYLPLSLCLSALSSFVALGLSQPAFGQTPAYGQTPPLELPSAPAWPPAPQPRIVAPNPVIPTLPGLGDFSRYEPQDQTVYVVLRLGQRKVYVYQGQKVVASYPVAIGRPEFPTPTGEFKVFEMIVNPAWQSPWTGEIEPPGIDGSLGLRWIGFAEMSNGVIGFHGTPNVASIGRAASHGCVRMRNEDIVKMYELIKVGTLVRVEP